MKVVRDGLEPPTFRFSGGAITLIVLPSTRPRGGVRLAPKAHGSRRCRQRCRQHHHASRWEDPTQGGCDSRSPNPVERAPRSAIVTVPHDDHLIRRQGRTPRLRDLTPGQMAVADRWRVTLQGGVAVSTAVHHSRGSNHYGALVVERQLP